MQNTEDTIAEKIILRKAAGTRDDIGDIMQVLDVEQELQDAAGADRQGGPAFLKRSRYRCQGQSAGAMGRGAGAAKQVQVRGTRWRFVGRGAGATG